MSADRLRELDERIAELFRDGSPISTRAEPPLTTSVESALGAARHQSQANGIFARQPERSDGAD